MTQEQRERLARLVLGSCWEPGRVQWWLDADTDVRMRIVHLSSGELALMGVAHWLRTGQPTTVLVSDLAKLDERCRQRVVFALRLLYCGGDADYVDSRLTAKEWQDAEHWRAVAA